MSYPPTDLPGVNTALRPEAAPGWLRPVVDAVHHGHASAALERELHERYKEDDPSKRAAVLMLLASREASTSDAETLPGDASVLLTHRSPRLRSHSGQIAFPGGRVDPGDIDIVDCALREAWEETGLDRRSVTPLAALDEVQIRPTGNPVHPIVAHWDNEVPVGVIDPMEADEVFLAPLSELILPDNRITVSRGLWTGPAFLINDYLVWGFTGGLLSVMIQEAGWEQPWDRSHVVPLEEALATTRNNERWGRALP
ncbi:NUDIX hydrolase [Corynebacterium vitaeruminis]|uniref:NUDIX hydrolase n=1 Tax=Corynebacterium vitaeruminis TaxID=38305 RepID=UPI0023F97D1D|nr:CoA pyrophosphatase [Corynebacterium vitaeruminis]